MANRIEGMTAVVTGATAGIGEATAWALADGGQGGAFQAPLSK